MELFGNLGTGDRLTIYNVIGPLLLVALVTGTVLIHTISGSNRSAIWTQFLIAFRRGWRFWWRVAMAPFVGSYHEIIDAYREFLGISSPSESWSGGLRDRARERGRMQRCDSAKLTREDRQPHKVASKR